MTYSPPCFTTAALWTVSTVYGIADFVRIGFPGYRLTAPLVGVHHRLDGKVLLDALTAGAAIDFGKVSQSLCGLICISDQEARSSVLNHFTTGPEVHRDDRHAGRVGFHQNESKSLRNRIQV